MKPTDYAACSACVVRDACAACNVFVVCAVCVVCVVCAVCNACTSCGALVRDPLCWRYVPEALHVVRSPRERCPRSCVDRQALRQISVPVRRTR